MLDVRRMKVLREVARQGSFSAAAEALAFTQSAVSQQVAALEREAGATLVERRGRGIRLTDAGHALVTHTDAILARLGDAEQELAAIAGLRGGRLRLGSFLSGGATLIPHAVAAFRAEHPDVELSMVEVEPEEAIDRLKRGQLDLALMYEHESMPYGLDPALEITPLLDDPYDVVLPKGHALAASRRLRLSQLSGESWICGTPRDSCQKVMIHSCNDAGFQPRVAFQTDDHHASQALVAAGVGVSLLPRLCLSTVHPAVEVRSLGRDAPVRRVFAGRLAEGYRSPATEAMIAVLEEIGAGFRGLGAADHDRETVPGARA